MAWVIQGHKVKDKRLTIFIVPENVWSKIQIYQIWKWYLVKDQKLLLTLGANRPNTSFYLQVINIFLHSILLLQTISHKKNIYTKQNVIIITKQWPYVMDRLQIVLNVFFLLLSALWGQIWKDVYWIIQNKWRQTTDVKVLEKILPVVHYDHCSQVMVINQNKWQ